VREENIRLNRFDNISLRGPRTQVREEEHPSRPV
jgi:hypothetical protein